MALYRIIETPGKKEVYPPPDAEPNDPDYPPLRTQDEAKIELQRQRGLARSEGLAQFVGLYMYETGNPISMSDAVSLLVDHYEATKTFVGPKADEGILARAREIRRAQKEAMADA